MSDDIPTIIQPTRHTNSTLSKLVMCGPAWLGAFEASEPGPTESQPSLTLVVRKKRELERNWQTMLQVGPSSNAHPNINEDQLRNAMWTRKWIDWEGPERDYTMYVLSGILSQVEQNQATLGKLAEVVSLDLAWPGTPQFSLGLKARHWPGRFLEVNEANFALAITNRGLLRSSIKDTAEPAEEEEHKRAGWLTDADK
ncbi:hypothetical protein BDP27DRAFT_1367846 [Rhodocollybia butyracea]|uniref:Uncharacterized protein n=1 Tax=Rhodocollybia butyracea TaxID=206335 RepID=A0A9P5PHV3_9AGAR|nr:hypothetical protein BDP27DRAFT_1367846 [Rhodocollybia butyracea]